MLKFDNVELFSYFGTNIDETNICFAEIKSAYRVSVTAICTYTTFLCKKLQPERIINYNVTRRANIVRYITLLHVVHIGNVRISLWKPTHERMEVKIKRKTKGKVTQRHVLKKCVYRAGK